MTLELFLASAWKKTEEGAIKMENQLLNCSLKSLTPVHFNPLNSEIRESSISPILTLAHIASFLR